MNETGGTPARICVIGLWHLGTVMAACFADWGYSVVGADPEPAGVKSLSDGTPTLFEPGLEALIRSNAAAGRLRFTTDLKEAAQGAAFIWIAYDTPLNNRDEADLSVILESVNEVAPVMDEQAILVVSSQVPVGTCERLEGMIRKRNTGVQHGVAYVPENLRLGLAIERFRRPDWIVIGADDEVTRQRVEALWQYADSPKLAVSLRTAEMTKHAINAFLCTSISLANELGRLCDFVGADGLAVAQAMRLDSRIGPKARVQPGLGFAGGTLARDLVALQAVAAQVGTDVPLVKAVLEVNRCHNLWVVDMLRRIFPDLSKIEVGIWGLTYTPNTSTLRRSVSLETIRALKEAGAAVKAYDPKADLSELDGSPDFAVVSDPYRAAEGSDALVVMTEWQEFREVDFDRVKALLRRPIVLDARNWLSPEALAARGLRYAGIGRGQVESLIGG